MHKYNNDSFSLNGNTIQLKLEPVYSSHNHLVGYEALSRVKTSSNEPPLVSAEAFFNDLTAEELNLIFHYQVRFAARYCDFFYKNNLFLSLNATGTVLSQYPWQDIKKEAFMIEKVLKIEVNEKVIPCSKTIALLENINDLVPVWLDDFSLSAFSFDYIVHGHFDCIKIDKEIYWKLRNSAAGINYLSSFCDLLADNNKKVIFEGIETLTDQKNLARCGATAGQGWLWASQEPHEIVS